ncbi:hypothetical protein OJF2_66800 [Aquisphaera giovannonii]|uniref:Gingipain domain-containing protein n=1 Tax=Aquisphaera giovannonii TaxID=406548 RepID=A0A5B9WBX8_9BACT|nr:hypothetical protein [Aquisphaera giovannonii]QEH38082.1 hypothetical protein OJF2_66800 [Aquisphaera giovannonii]
MIRTLAALAALSIFVASSAQAPAAEPAGRYAIVVRRDVAAGPWGRVVRALEARHSGRTFAYDKGPEDVRRDVGAFRPRYVCFVCAPTEDFPAFALVANEFCRGLDDDPYVDAIWGILTGLDADHGLTLANAPPVAIRRAFTKTQGAWLDWVPEGDYVTEWARDRGELGEKKPGSAFALKPGGPASDAEDARYVHKLLSEDRYDLIIGSGHGGHRDWMLMYPRGKGSLTARDGGLTMTAPGVDLPLATSRPKVYWAVGNCLTGVVNSGRDRFQDSYALAWMNHGAVQYLGAVQSTWYELNWNMADWFLKQEGRWTFSESLFLLRQWSRHLLAENIATGRDREGTEFTDGIFVLYGDPALEARVEKARDPALDESLDVRETEDKDVVRITYKVKVNFVGEGNKRTAEKYDGWRIFVYLLPFQVADAKVEKTDFAKVVLPGETILWDAGPGLKVGDERSVTFTARRLRD